MTHNDISKMIEELSQRRIQLKIKLNQLESQNTFIDTILSKNQGTLSLANDKIKKLKVADVVDMEAFLRLKASCEPVVAVIDANLFRKQQNSSQILIAQREFKELDFEKKRLERMLNETSKIYNLFQEKTRKDIKND
jgi:hypothetical protein